MSKEKQIEEMAEVLRLSCENECFKNEDGFVDCEACKACLLYDAGYRKQSEWISVEERLPEKQANFLIADDKGHMEIALWTKQFGWFSGSNRVKKVTHWMPLPEPPKMKGGAE